MSLFDTTNSSSTGIQDGEHVGVVVGAEVKDTKNGDGKYINLKWQLENGMSLFKMYMIQHSNEKAVQIGVGNLGKIQVMSGKAKGPVESTDELLGLRCTLVIRNKTDEYGEKADIVNYKKAPADIGDLPL